MGCNQSTIRGPEEELKPSSNAIPLGRPSVEDMKSATPSGTDTTVATASSTEKTASVQPPPPSPNSRKLSSPSLLSPKKVWSVVNGGNNLPPRSPVPGGLPPAPPLMVARPRSDTWEVTAPPLSSSPPSLLDQSASSRHPPQQPYELCVIDVTDSSANRSSAAPSPSRIQPPPPATTTLQDQWKMLWETQSLNLVDPPDVLAVIDCLLDKTVNQLSPVQVTLIQRKVRIAMYHMIKNQHLYNGNNQNLNAASQNNSIASVNTGSGIGSSSSSKFSKVFGGGSSASNQNNNNSILQSKQLSYSDTRTMVDKYHLLPEAMVRQMILPRLGTSVLSSVTTNAISFMLSLSCTSSESFVWDRTSFAANAAAENAKLEMDVNKKTALLNNSKSNATAQKTNTMPKPSQVPIIEGWINNNSTTSTTSSKSSRSNKDQQQQQQQIFPPGITLTALCAIISLATTGTRIQKLQLLFYICMDTNILNDFLLSHPAGGVAVWLLEVDNNIVISLASLIHYHYYGHAFLPTNVPYHDEQDTNSKTEEQKEQDGGSTTASTSNGTNNHYTKHRFIASQSRRPVSISMDRILNVIQSIVEMEQQNVRMYQERKLNEQQQQEQPESSTNENDDFNENLTTSYFSNNNDSMYQQPQSASASLPSMGKRRSSINDLQAMNNGTSQREENNKSLNSSIHKKLMGRRVASTQNLSSMNNPYDGSVDSASNGSGRNITDGVNNDLPLPFAVTDVMEKVLDVQKNASRMRNTNGGATTMNSVVDETSTISTAGGAAISGGGGTFCYPAEDGTSLSPSLDTSREQFLAGTSIFVQNRFGRTIADTSDIELYLDDYVKWADIAIDDLTLNIVMYKLFGEGILPSPALERDVVVTKWIEWQSTIRSIMTIANSINHRDNDEDDGNVIDSSNDRKDESSKDNNNTDNKNNISDSGYDVGDHDDNNDKKSNHIAKETNSMLHPPTTAPNDFMIGDSYCGENISNNNQHCNWKQVLRGVNGKKGKVSNRFFVWGGIGNVDGGGGIGYGVLYCISKDWWDQWTAYTGWSFYDSGAGSNSNNDSNGKSSKLKRIASGNSRVYSYGEKRPWTISTEALLEHDHDSIVRGSMGSYEVMKPGLVRGEDYVLVPPGVWDALYELYGGGPPLPRMIRSPDRHFSESHRTGSIEDLSVGAPPDDDGDDYGNLVDVLDESGFSNAEYNVSGIGNVPTNIMPMATRIPDSLSVTLHPWILHVQLCDPAQPYRRSETGLVSIRVMATPYQPLWRIYAEALCRFSFQQYKAFDSIDGRGKARLWKRTEPSSSKEPAPRYGPWNLLCKNRHAILPMMSSITGYGVIDYDMDGEELVANWKEYADNATLETGGLMDQDQLMLEFAVQNKNGELTWPREAAAKAGRVRRLAAEDHKFRGLLQGLGEDGTVLVKPPSLIGMAVDAMDSSGRWYTVKILEVDVVDDDTDEDVDDDVSVGGKSASNSNANQQSQQPLSRKKVKVFFNHFEWIDVDSDRLATAGRFASQADPDGGSASSPTQGSALATGSTANGTSASTDGNKSKNTAVARKANTAPDLSENAKLCTLPGLGACGLINLGNTCYMNSAFQCISYLPILRSYLVSAQYKSTGDLNKENFLGSGGKLLEETAELMRMMWSATVGEKSPSKFRLTLGKSNPQFSGADQQDAQEFLNYIIDALHEDSYKGKKKPYVEPIEDDWIKQTNLARVGEEAWRRFLRRNRSVMADVAMGQALNTVTCPVCSYSSRNFDPFNLLSIPIPTVADVLFRCTVYRRATAKNCPWVLDRVRKGDKRQSRFDISSGTNGEVGGPPSDHFVAEQYIIALSRLADSGDLRLQIQNLSGIRANQLRLCRFEEVVVNNDVKEGAVVKTHKKVFPLSDKDGPASQQVKKHGPNEETSASRSAIMTEIVAFEMTLAPRTLDASKNGDNGDDEEEEEQTGDDFLPSPRMAALIEKHLKVYGDELECRLVDTDSLVIAKAVSRSLWPRSEDELKLGLRVDAMDHRGNWFPGSVIEIVDEKVGGSVADGDAGEPHGGRANVGSKRVRVHFDNFSPKWDEMYSIEHLKQGRVRPLYLHAVPKRKPTEFLVHHRHTDRQTGQLVFFGQSFYVQCQNEWSNARAGAHILSQVCRFMHYRSSKSQSTDDSNDPDGRNEEMESKALRLYERTHSAISDLIDLLVDCDREYIRLALGVSQHNNAEEKSRPYRNPTFDASLLSSALVKKVAGLLQRLPFEVRICSVEGAHSDRPSAHSEEVLFPFSLVRTIGNFINIRHAVFLQWREPTVADKKQPASVASYRSFLSSPVMYVDPAIQIHETSASLMDEDSARDGKKRKGPAANKKNASTKNGGSHGIELSYCLKEFCKVQKLSISDSWKCPVCKVHREGGQNMNLWRLPDLLTFHIKRFNMSARWHEKITTKVNFPLTGLDMRDFCHKDSPVVTEGNDESSIYDLIGVMNHYGSMSGGHYVATCKATACSKYGREEVAYSFNGAGASTSIDSAIYYSSNSSSTGSDANSVNLGAAWGRLGGGGRTNNNKNQQQDVLNQSKLTAAMSSRSASESAEPVWLQFDDEVVEPIPPVAVVSEMAYVLFYRRRNISSSNIAKYSTLE